MDATVKTEMHIPMFVPDIQEQDIALATDVIRSGMLVQGANVALLEAAFCKITGAKHAVAVSNAAPHFARFGNWKGR
jgi:dTDP-4-amino-4,6-dideoxygalactose transaminase